MVFTWPSTTKAHSAFVGRTMEDPDFKEYDEAYNRLKSLRRRFESFMIMIRLGSGI